MTEKELSLHFPSFEKELVDELLNAGEVKTVKEGELLVRTGQNIRSALLVLDGLIKIYREDEQGNEFFMYYINSGKACAISLVCALGRETSGVMAKAAAPSTVISIPLHHIDEWMGKYKSWAQFAVSSYRERFDELLKTIDHIAFRNMDERLVFYLRRFQETQKTDTVTTSFTDIANDLNSSREVISRLMKKLSERGIVELQSSKVRLINLNKAL